MIAAIAELYGWTFESLYNSVVSLPGMVGSSLVEVRTDGEPRPHEDVADKVAFIAELRDVRLNRRGPWVIFGDLNMSYRDDDKSKGNLHHHMMGCFRRFLNDLSLRRCTSRHYT